jgi:hypothetical protein
MGKPIFIVIDEYPAIVAKCPTAQGHIATLLREGAKYKIFLCVASQDFQVKTAFPDVGGGIRDCFKTILHVGGDIHTVRALLDIDKVDRAEEASLGKGLIYLRCETHKQAGLANTPWMDNEAIFELVGPSTYVEDDDIEIEMDNDDDPRAYVRLHAPLGAETDRQEATAKAKIEDKGPRAENIDIDVLVFCWNGGANSIEKLMKAFKMTHHQATLARKRIMECASDHIAEAEE